MSRSLPDLSHPAMSQGSVADYHMNDSHQSNRNSSQFEMNPQNPAPSFVNNPDFWSSLMNGVSDRIALAITRAPQPVIHTSRPKLGNPVVFDGDRKKFKSFLQSIELHFQVDTAAYATDAAKIGFLQSFTKGSALEWIVARREVLNETYAQFFQAFHTIYHDPHEQEDKENRLLHLVQGKRSCAEYTAEFRNLTATLNLGNQAEMLFFWNGLNRNIKDIAALEQKPSTIDKLIKQALTIDYRLSERHRERKRTGFYKEDSTSQNTPRSNPVQTDDPMQIDSMNTPRGPLTPEELARRIRENLCKYCGGPGHFANQCPKKSLRSRVRFSRSPPRSSPSEAIPTNSSGQGKVQPSRQ